MALEPEAEEVAAAEDGMVRLFVNAGRRNGVRPADIVGAIANEAGAGRHHRGNRYLRPFYSC